MRKIILLEHVSLDGYAAGPNGEMDWIRYDQALESYAHSLHATTDTALYGRVTYQMMEGYWPTVPGDPNSTQAARNHANWLENATKVVLSRTLDKPTWQKTVVISDNIGDEITRLKQQPGKDIWIVGSISVAQALMRLGLIDEYRINVNPVVLGGGNSLFGDVKLNLKLCEAISFNCGVMGLRYEPAT